MRFLLRRFTGPVWDCPSAVPSLHRITAGCGRPTSLHAAQVFTSFYLPESKHNDARPLLPVTDTRNADRMLWNFCGVTIFLMGDSSVLWRSEQTLTTRDHVWIS